MAIKILNNKKKSIIKRLPHVPKEATLTEQKFTSTIHSLSKKLPGQGCVTIRSCTTFIKHVSSKQMKKITKRRNKPTDSSVDFTPCTSPSNSSNENDGYEFGSSPTSQDAKAMFSIEGSPSNIMEEDSEEESVEEYMSTSCEEIEDLDAIVTEYDDVPRHAVETLTTIKEFIFDDDDTKVIFHFDKSNKWTLEIIEDNKKNISSITSFPKKHGIPVPSMYLKAILPEKVNMKQGKEYVERLISNDIVRVKAALPEKVNIKQSKEYVKRAVSKDIERVKKSAGEVLELLISIDSSVSTLTNESFSRGVANAKTAYCYIRIVR